MDGGFGPSNVCRGTNSEGAASASVCFCNPMAWAGPLAAAHRVAVTWQILGYVLTSIAAGVSDYVADQSVVSTRVGNWIREGKEDSLTQIAQATPTPPLLQELADWARKQTGLSPAVLNVREKRSSTDYELWPMLANSSLRYFVLTPLYGLLLPVSRTVWCHLPMRISLPFITLQAAFVGLGTWFTVYPVIRNDEAALKRYHRHLQQQEGLGAPMVPWTPAEGAGRTWWDCVCGTQVVDNDALYRHQRWEEADSLTDQEEEIVPALAASTPSLSK